MSKHSPDSEQTVYVSLEQLVRLQYEAHGFSWLPKQPLASLLSGRFSSRLRGRGLTFEELRDYRPGDDIRNMDWRATARLRKPHVRVYAEERERPILLVVDQRANMFFGSSRATKSMAAAEMAALGAWRALDNGDRVGAVIFGDNDLVQIRPHRSRQNALRICNELVCFGRKLSATRSASNKQMLNEALRRAGRMAKHDNLVVLVTDYFGDDEETQKLVSRLAVHNDVLAALVYDPLGIRFPFAAGELAATDGEQRVNFSLDGRFNERFQEVFVERTNELRRLLRKIRVPVLTICTHDPVIAQLRMAFGGAR